MKQTILFRCNICGKEMLAKEENANFVFEELRKHEKVCNGMFNIIEGVCFEEAMHNSIIDKRLLFCYYYFTDKLINKKCIHCWNELKGNMVNGKLIIGEGDYYILDTSNRFNAECMKRDLYYQIKEIDEKNVYRLELRELLLKVVESIDKGEDYRRGFNVK